MGYQMANGRWANTEDVVLLGSATRTANVNGDEYEMGDRVQLRLNLDVTAASGTSPTLDVTVQTRASATASWRTVGTFAQATAVGGERKSFPGCDRFVRAISTLGGTSPSFTFSVSGEAV